MIIFKIFLALLLALSFSGCFSEPKPAHTIKANEKAFEEEDAYILFALRAEQLQDFVTASSLFNSLWEKSNKKEYLYKSLQNDLYANQNNKVINRVDEITKGSLKDFKLLRFKIIALVSELKYERARVIAIQLVERSKSVDDYILLSGIYVKQKKFDTALKYLESAYTKDYNEKILDRMSIILYVNMQRQKDAIAQLETHTRMHGCSKMICTRLIGFYSNENNIQGLLSVYLRMYELEKNSDIANKIVQVYVYQKDYIKLMGFLKRSESDDELLLRMYINVKNYKAASSLANKLYSQTGDINYLGQSAIFEYESSDNKNDKEMLDRVVLKLKEVVEIESVPLYLNYLGYLLIDHSIDIKDGIRYIKEALKFNENSAFYLDSLAWGYYKLHECKKATKIINRVQTLDGGDDQEVLNHVEAIKKCKNKKGKDKK